MSPTLSSLTGGAAGAGIGAGAGAAATVRGGGGGIGRGGGIAMGLVAGAGLGFGAAFGLITFGFAAFGFVVVFLAAGLRALSAFGFALALATFFFAAFFGDFFKGFLAVFRAGFFATFFRRAGRVVGFLRDAALRGLAAFFGAFDFFAFAFVFDVLLEVFFFGLAVFAMALPHLLRGSIILPGHSQSSGYRYRSHPSLSSIKVVRGAISRCRAEILEGRCPAQG